ncbi:MAG: hypothetical protein KC425_12635, partial [Anaerolineales bacterium]|nr:hypothetical protein [Anaerolineales bacterium]
AFHAARSQTEASSQTASSRWPEGAAMPPQRIHFQVAGEGALAEALAAALAARLPDAVPAAETAVADLRVRIEAADVTWTPVYGRAEVTASAAYSSDGEFGFWVERPYHFQFDDDDTRAAQVVRVALDVTVRDRSIGLLSRPAYHALLADRLALEVNQMLQMHVFAAP